MWFGLINEIKSWYIRTFITRNCWMPEGNVSFTSTWSEEELRDINKKLDGGNSNVD